MCVHFRKKLPEYWGECMPNEWEISHHTHHTHSISDSLVDHYNLAKDGSSSYILNDMVITELPYASGQTLFHRRENRGTDTLCFPRIPQLFKVRTNTSTRSPGPSLAHCVFFLPYPLKTFIESKLKFQTFLCWNPQNCNQNGALVLEMYILDSK